MLVCSVVGRQQPRELMVKGGGGVGDEICSNDTSKAIRDAEERTSQKDAKKRLYECQLLNRLVYTILKRAAYHPRCQNCSSTAGLSVSYKLGVRWHFCLQGPILNPRSVLDSSAQTTRGNQLDFFGKT